MTDERLSEHFWLSEFTRSETATRLGLTNDPPPEVLVALRENAAGMELVRALLKVPVLVSSGYRGEQLERVLTAKDYGAWCVRHSMMPSTSAWRTYFERKHHPRGRATDFTAPAFGSPAQVCRAIASSDIQFAQLIHEHTWVHIGWPKLGELARREVLTLVAGGYVPGIQESAVA